MPTKHQYDLAKALTKSFEKLRCSQSFHMDEHSIECAPKIMIYNLLNDKIYHFSDPDWEIVIKQLITLYKSLKRKLQENA